MNVPESSEVRHEQFWRDGGGFVWCWPRFDIVKPADTRPRVLWNRYPHNIIGAMVVLFGRGWGVRWRRTPPHVCGPACHTDDVGEGLSE